MVALECFLQNILGYRVVSLDLSFAKAPVMRGEFHLLGLWPCDGAKLSSCLGHSLSSRSPEDFSYQSPSVN